MYVCRYVGESPRLLIGAQGVCGPVHGEFVVDVDVCDFPCIQRRSFRRGDPRVYGPQALLQAHLRAALVVCTRIVRRVATLFAR